MPPIMASGDVDGLAFIGGSRAADDLIKEHPNPHRLKVFLQLEANNMGVSIRKDRHVDRTLCCLVPSPFCLCMLRLLRLPLLPDLCSLRRFICQISLQLRARNLWKMHSQKHCQEH